MAVFFFSLQFFSPVRCPMHCRVAIPISEGLTLESWNFTLTERYDCYNFRQTKFKGLPGLFKDEVEIKKLKLSVHFFLHSVYQCFSYLFSYKIFGSSPINSPNHFIYQESCRASTSRPFWDQIKKSSSFQGLHQGHCWNSRTFQACVNHGEIMP